MYCPDTNFLIDYLDEDRPASEDAKTLLKTNPDHECRIPSAAFFEALRGGARLRGAVGVADLIEQLDWTAYLPLTPLAAREAALINGELEKAGQKINLGDVLIAGTVRETGGTIITCNSHFKLLLDSMSDNTESLELSAGCDRNHLIYHSMRR